MPAETARRRPAALLWDFDGTLVESEAAWVRAERRLAEELGGTWSDDQGDAAVGQAIVDTAADVLAAAGRDDLDPLEWAGVLTRYAAQEVASQTTEFRPGALELLADARRAGVPCALVSATWSSSLHAFLPQVPPGSFAVVVGGDDVTHGKPAPDPYLLAARQLGVDAAACVALEDSLTGSASALAAGCVVVGVPFRQQLTPRPGLVLRDTLVGLTVDDLGALWHEVRGG